MLTEVILYIFTVILGVIGAIITWIVSPYFLSRRDYYRNSRYKIFRQKFLWSATTFGFIIVVGVLLIKKIYNLM